MQGAHHRHDISDKVWELLDPLLPGREGTRGVTARDNRKFFMQFFGFSVQVRRGVNYPLTMETGKIPIAAFAGGEIGEFGKDYSKFLYPSQTLNGL